MISQRVKSGMENAKAKGKAIGRPAVTADSIPAIFYKHYPKYKRAKSTKRNSPGCVIFPIPPSTNIYPSLMGEHMIDNDEDKITERK